MANQYGDIFGYGVFSGDGGTNLREQIPTAAPAPAPVSEDPRIEVAYHPDSPNTQIDPNNGYGVEVKPNDDRDVEVAHGYTEVP